MLQLCACAGGVGKEFVLAEDGESVPEHGAVAYECCAEMGG